MASDEKEVTLDDLAGVLPVPIVITVDAEGKPVLPVVTDQNGELVNVTKLFDSIWETVENMLQEPTDGTIPTAAVSAEIFSYAILHEPNGTVAEIVATSQKMSRFLQRCILLGYISGRYVTKKEYKTTVKEVTQEEIDATVKSFKEKK